MNEFHTTMNKIYYTIIFVFPHIELIYSQSQITKIILDVSTKANLSHFVINLLKLHIDLYFRNVWQLFILACILLPLQTTTCCYCQQQLSFSLFLLTLHILLFLHLGRNVQFSDDLIKVRFWSCNRQMYFSSARKA